MGMSFQSVSENAVLRNFIGDIAGHVCTREKTEEASNESRKIWMSMNIKKA